MPRLDGPSPPVHGGPRAGSRRSIKRAVDNAQAKQQLQQQLETLLGANRDGGDANDDGGAGPAAPPSPPPVQTPSPPAAVAAVVAGGSASSASASTSTPPSAPSTPESTTAPQSAETSPDTYNPVHILSGGSGGASPPNSADSNCRKASPTSPTLLISDADTGEEDAINFEANFACSRSKSLPATAGKGKLSRANSDGIISMLATVSIRTAAPGGNGDGDGGDGGDGGSKAGSPDRPEVVGPPLSSASKRLHNDGNSGPTIPARGTPTFDKAALPVAAPASTATRRRRGHRRHKSFGGLDDLRNAIEDLRPKEKTLTRKGPGHFRSGSTGGLGAMRMIDPREIMGSSSTASGASGGGNGSRKNLA